MISLFASSHCDVKFCHYHYHRHCRRCSVAAVAVAVVLADSFCVQVCAECNKNVVQCLLHFINLKTVSALFWCLYLVFAFTFSCRWPISSDNTMAATPIIDKLNGNICSAAFLFYSLFYSTHNPLLVFMPMEFHMQINIEQSHTHAFTLRRAILDAHSTHFRLLCLSNRHTAVFNSCSFQRTFNRLIHSSFCFVSFYFFFLVFFYSRLSSWESNWMHTVVFVGFVVGIPIYWFDRTKLWRNTIKFVILCQTHGCKRNFNETLLSDKMGIVFRSFRMVIRNNSLIVRS